MAPSTKKIAPSKEAPATPVRKKTKHEAVVHGVSSPNGRAKCQRCGDKIAQGQDRDGKDYGDGYRWWHTDCWGVYYHKYEKDCSGRAKCKRCEKPITKGTNRVSKEVYPIKEGSFAYGYIHYHPSCLTQEELADLGLESEEGVKSEKSTLARQETDERNKRKTSRDDPQEKLRNRLKELRSKFAMRLSAPTMKVFSDEVIKGICQSMPKNKEELLKIKGMGDKKFQSFGDSILALVQHHRNQTASKQTSIAGFFKPLKPTQDIQVLESLSCEEIVNRKFEDAKKNGYIITCD